MEEKGIMIMISPHRNKAGELFDNVTAEEYLSFNSIRMCVSINPNANFNEAEMGLAKKIHQINIAEHPENYEVAIYANEEFLLNNEFLFNATASMLTGSYIYGSVCLLYVAPGENIKALLPHEASCLKEWIEENTSLNKDLLNELRNSYGDKQWIRSS